MLNYFASFGASSSFEKNRLIATTKNLEAPEEQIIKKILNTFEGQDEETRAQIAFATIYKKIQTSDSNQNWIYLLKNLIILDRMVQDLCFVEEVADLRLPVIQEYEEKDSQYFSLRTDQLVKNYWKFIKEQSKLLRTNKHILYFSRSQRSQFLQTLEPKQILKQIDSLEYLFKLVFTILGTIQSKQGLNAAAAKSSVLLQKSKLISYVKLKMLYKLIGFYSCQMLCTNRFVILLTNDANMEMVQVDSMRNFKQSLVKFKANSATFIEFVQRNKELIGFQDINYRDFDPMPGNNLLKSIEKYMVQKMNFDSNNQNVLPYISSIPLKLHIKRSRSGSDKIQIPFQQRKIIAANRLKKEPNSSFSNWKSSYSQDFPQKQIMTVDLILELKKEQSKERLSNYDDLIAYGERETCIIASHEQFPDEVQFQKPSIISMKQNDKNLYSELETVWNS